MSKRLTPLGPDQLSDAQRALYERVAGGPRRKMGISLTDEEGALLGPFNAYLHTPELGARLARSLLWRRGCARSRSS